MTDQEAQAVANVLAELYIRRRREWFLAIDQVMVERNGIRPLGHAIDHKRKAEAKWDQMFEVVDLLPQELKELVLQQIEKIK